MNPELNAPASKTAEPPDVATPSDPGYIGRLRECGLCGANVFVGERGELTDRGVRNLCDKYSAICGFKLHPYLLRHTMAHQFLVDNQNDLVSLAQILGHENLNTTARYTKRTQGQLGEASDRLSY